MNRTAVTFASSLFLLLSAVANAASPLSFEKAISLPGVQGKFDHFAIDLEGHRLFAAATGNHSIEVIDISEGKVIQSITGLGKPHGLVWQASTKILYVADGTQRNLQKFEGNPFKLTGKIALSDDADDMVMNPATHLLYVGHGGSDAANPARVAVVDTASFTLKADIPVASHPEALDLDLAGNRIFANIADRSEVAAIDGKTNKIAAHWKLAQAADNVPMAYDSTDDILYIAARAPSSVIALNASTGAELSRATSGSGADDLFYDDSLRRIYVIAGGGEVDSYQAEPGSPLRSIGVVTTEPGAKTALFVPSLSLLCVGIPGANGRPAEIRVYDTAAARGKQ